MPLNGSGGMTNTEPVGFVCGTKGDSVSFLVNKDVCLSFGQIVRIDSGERIFYARVVNSKSSSTLELIEQLREAEGKEAFGPYSAYRSVDAILFLEKRLGRVRSPTFNPNYRDKVYAASEEDCSILKLSGELEVGHLRSEDHLLGSVGINVDAIPRMMGMFGMTGSGKTNTELILNAQIIDNSPKTVALIFDFAGQDRFSFMIEDLIRGSRITLFVTDSTPKNVLNAKKMLKWLKKLKGGRIFGIANKQDLEGVLSPDRVEKMLGVKTYGMIAIDSRKKVHMYRILMQALQETF